MLYVGSELPLPLALLRTVGWPTCLVVFVVIVLIRNIPVVASSVIRASATPMRERALPITGPASVQVRVCLVLGVTGLLVARVLQIYLVGTRPEVTVSFGFVYLMDWLNLGQVYELPPSGEDRSAVDMLNLGRVDKLPPSGESMMTVDLKNLD